MAMCEACLCTGPPNRYASNLFLVWSINNQQTSAFAGLFVCLIRITILQSRYKTSLPSLSTSCFSCEPSDAASTVPRRGKHTPFRRETSRECHKVCIPFPSSPLPSLVAWPQMPPSWVLPLPLTPACSAKLRPPTPPRLRASKRSSTPYLQPKTSLHAATTPSRLCLKHSPSLPPLGHCPARSLPRRPGAHGRAPLAARATSLSLSLGLTMI